MHGCFLFCLFPCSFVDFLKNRTYILIKDKLSPVFKHGFFWSEENVKLNHFPTQDGVTVLVCPVIVWTLNILLLYFMADVMPYVLWHMTCLGRCYCQLMADVIAMLCVGDVITTRQMV